MTEASMLKLVMRVTSGQRLLLLGCCCTWVIFGRAQQGRRTSWHLTSFNHVQSSFVTGTCSSCGCKRSLWILADLEKQGCWPSEGPMEIQRILTDLDRKRLHGTRVTLFEKTCTFIHGYKDKHGARWAGYCPPRALHTSNHFCNT